MLGDVVELSMNKKKEIAREVAKLITSAKGENAKAQLKQLYNATVKDELTREQADRLSNLLINNTVLMPAMFGVQELNRGMNDE
jgi:ribosomal protein L17